MNTPLLDVWYSEEQAIMIYTAYKISYAAGKVAEEDAKAVDALEADRIVKKAAALRRE
jgi:hypothetical protein